MKDQVIHIRGAVFPIGPVWNRLMRDGASAPSKAFIWSRSPRLPTERSHSIPRGYSRSSGGGNGWLPRSLTALLIGAFYAYILATRLYHATAVLRLLLEQEQIIDFPNGAGRLSGNRAELNSEVEVLRGRVLLAQVVERLILASDVEFSARFRPEEAQRVQDAVISKLLKAVTIRNIPQSRVLHVTVESEDARKAALIAETMVELYVSHQIEEQAKAAQQAVIWLAGRATAMQTNPNRRSERLRVQCEHGTGFGRGPSGGGGAADQGVAWQYCDGAGSERSLGKTERGSGSRSDICREGNASADTQLAGLFDGLEEEPALARAFEARFQTVLQVSWDHLFRSQQQLAALRASKAELSAQASQQGRDLIILQQLTREAEAARVLYEHFLSRLKETTALQGNHTRRTAVFYHMRWCLFAPRLRAGF